MEEIVQSIKTNRSEYNLTIPEPMSADEVNLFMTKLNKFFGEDPDSTFVTFLKLCNGLQENGNMIYAGEDYEINGIEYRIFQNNQAWYDIEDFRDYIFYGDSEIGLFCYDKENQEYLMLARDGDGIDETFASCEEMLLFMLKQMVGE